MFDLSRFMNTLLFIGHKLGEFVSTRSFKSHIKTDRKTKR